MFKSINRNNRLFMLGNFLFALSFGLWMNLRQLHLLAFGATAAEIGSVFALAAAARRDAGGPHRAEASHPGRLANRGRRGA